MSISASHALPLWKKLFSHCDSHTDNAPQKWDDDWDMKHGKPGHGIRQIVLIRHGQYEQGKRGDEHKKLTTLGREQAVQSGKRVRELLDGKILFPVRNVYYSTNKRATETYQLVQPSLPPLEDHQCQPCSMIREGAVCRPEPKSLHWDASDEDFKKEGMRVEAAFVNHIHRAVGKHSGYQPVKAQTDPAHNGSADSNNKAVDKPESENYSDIFVCHGNVIRYFVMRALQLPPEAWLRLAVYNASITVIHIYPSGRVSLYMLGDVGHLPPSMVTYN